MCLLVGGIGAFPPPGTTERVIKMQKLETLYVVGRGRFCGDGSVFLPRDSRLGIESSLFLSNRGHDFGKL